MIQPNPNIQALMAATLVLKAKTVVELGTGDGVSTDAFLAALEVTDGVLYSIDLYPDSESVRKTIERLKSNPRFIFIHSDSCEAGKNWSSGKIDVLYVDSDHSYEHVLQELEVWGRLNPTAIFVHDLLDPNNQRAPPYFACEEYAKRTGRGFFAMEHFPCGLGVFLEWFK